LELEMERRARLKEKHGNGNGAGMTIALAAQMTGWPTPTTPSGGQTPPEGTSATGITPDGKKVQVTLKDVAAISGWPTPRASENVQTNLDQIAETGSSWLGQGRGATVSTMVQMAAWPTPQMRDFRSGGEDRVENPDRSNNLNDFVLMAGWPTPAQTDHKGGYQGGRMRDGKLSTDRLDVTAQLSGPARLTASGEMLIGSSAGMESGGQLAPSHSRWLMGLPRAWDECAIAALKVSRKK
jgi:hypothetical protein